LGDAANALLEAGQTVKMQDFHEIFGRSNEETLRATAKAMHIKVTGNLKPCEHCLVSKSIQKIVPKTTDPRSTVVSERLLLDISSVKYTSFGGCKFWLLWMNDATNKLKAASSRTRVTCLPKH
jgi:hypothetical protein